MTSLATTLSSEQDSLVADFMAFSGCSNPDQAQQFLTQTSWQLQDAVQNYMISSSSSSSSAQHNSSSFESADSSRSSGAASSSNNHESPHIRAPDPVKRQRLLEGPVYAGQPRRSDQSRETFRSFRAEAQQARRNRTGKSSQASNGRADVTDLTPKQQSLQSMFAPPTDLMFQGDFEMAKTAARSKGRWLLVNLQKNDEFSCHALNRDVWKDDYAKAVIGNSLVFWMDTVETNLGQRFATLYKVSSYPHVALIDPRTGEQSKIILSGGTMTARDFVEKVQDYIQRHTIAPFNSISDGGGGSGGGSSSSSSSSSNNSSSTDPSSVPTTTSSARQREEEEEEAELQAALAASMVDETSNATTTTTNNNSAEPSPSPPVPPLVNVTDYGVSPTEPDATSTPKEELTRLRIRLPSGKQLVRAFRKDNTVCNLFATVRVLLDEHGDAVVCAQNFELRSGYPPKILSDSLENTLTDAKLENATVQVSMLS
jgi:hypothetical protein